MTITLPGAKYGLISRRMVVFTMAVSEFGVPKVIGGNINVLAVDIFKQVIGQQNFSMGAVVGLLLLLPAVVAFVIDSSVQRAAAGAADGAQRAVPGRAAAGARLGAARVRRADVGADAAGASAWRSSARSSSSGRTTCR